MLKPDFVQDSQWKFILRQCIENNCNPYLIVAIGIHETGWGALGWGRKGFILGVGCFSENNADYNFQGFENQIKWAASQLGKFFGLHPTASELQTFASKIWRPGDSDAWASSVYKIFQKTQRQYGQEFPNFIDIPFYATSDLLFLYDKGFLNTPFGSSDFYRTCSLLVRIYKDIYNHLTK